jgi:hypothetical protein
MTQMEGMKNVKKRRRPDEVRPLVTIPRFHLPHLRHLRFRLFDSCLCNPPGSAGVRGAGDVV